MDFKQRQETEFNAFPKGFAFNNEQLKEEMAKLGVKSKDELTSIGYGGFIRKKDKEAYKALLVKQAKEKAAYLSVFEQLKDAIRYELGNHEYCVTMDMDDALYAVGLSWDDLANDPLKAKACREARDEYMAQYR